MTEQQSHLKLASSSDYQGGNTDINNSAYALVLMLMSGFGMLIGGVIGWLIGYFWHHGCP